MMSQMEIPSVGGVQVMKFNVFRGELVTQGSGFSLRPLQDSLVLHVIFIQPIFSVHSSRGVIKLWEEFSSLSESLSFESLLQPVHQHVHVLLSLLSFSVLLLWIEMQVTKSLPTPGKCSSRRAAFPRMYLLFFSCSPLWFRVSETVAEESRREDLVCPPQSRGHLSSLFIYLFFLRRTNS